MGMQVRQKHQLPSLPSSSSVLGSVMLFTTLAVIMMVTRKVNWYQYSDALRDKMRDKRNTDDVDGKDGN